MNSYFVWLPDWSNVSGGGALLHSFAVRLYSLGMDVYVNSNKQNPLWDKIPTFESFKGSMENVIAVYPEVTHGNPYNAKHVARYLLHIPGFFGGPKEFDKNDILFTHSTIFNCRIKLPEERLIRIPYINTDMFFDQKLNRDKVFAYRNKGTHYPHPDLKGIPLLGTGFDFNGNEGQLRLADLLNKTKILYCYDNITVMSDIARLCGCPVVIIPDPFWKEEEIKSMDNWSEGGIGYGLVEEKKAKQTIDSMKMRNYYRETFEQNSYHDLKRFVEITQKICKEDCVGIVKFSVSKPISYQGLQYRTHTTYEMDKSKFYSTWFIKGLIKRKQLKIIEDTYVNAGVNKPIQWAMRAKNEYKKGKPLVSICCLTYNHEKIIRDALDGFVIQRTNFPFEIVVCDDASTDNTQEIIKEYSIKYEGLFKLILLKENVYSKTKVLPFATHLFPAAEGKYIAECDGDDYWTDCYKLQKQFDFLEKNKEYSMCYHDLIIYYQDRDIASKGYQKTPPDYTSEELAGFERSGQWLHPSTKMWRNNFNDKTRKDFETCWGDNATNVHMSLYGGCKFIQDISPSVFRRFHGNNMWSCMGHDENKRETIKIFQRLYDFMKGKNEKFADIRYSILKGYEAS